MKQTKKKIELTGIALVALAASANAQPIKARVDVDVQRAGIAISPLLYGVFFEELNRAGDGGIYAEMIQNRSFEDSWEPVAWTLTPNATGMVRMGRDTSKPINLANPTSLRLEVAGPITRPVGVVNRGFVPFKPHIEAGKIHLVRGKKYDLTFYARSEGADSVVAALQTTGGTVLASQQVVGLDSQWKQFKATLVPSASDTTAQFVLLANKPATYWFDMVSLFPQDTWKGRKNGLRTNLMEKIAALKPAFVRFPGGCFVEGYNLENQFRWKETLGDIAARPGHGGLWGYRSTNGLGFHEYLQMCEDLKAEPLYVINAGMSHGGNVPMDKMGPFVQDAVDAIEYANGLVTSKWGAERAKNGHPVPFGMKMLQIGNENGGPEYNKRYALFYDAIKAKYPHIRVVACDWFGLPKSRPLNIIDSHHYGDPMSFLTQTERFDNYNRSGPKVYFGEYAVTQQSGKGNLQAAVAEAAFMMGLERNSDVVTMASYAPLLVNSDWVGWNPNAIVFDQSRAYGTPSYYVQSLFASNRPSRMLPSRTEIPQIPAPDIQGLVGVGTWSTQAEYKDIRVVRGEEVLYQSDFTGGTGDWKLKAGKWEAADGALRQTGSDNPSLAIMGSTSWKNYTLTLKARKISGDEGFRISFGAPEEGSSGNWNIGGWGNSGYGVESAEYDTPRVPGSIETGHWYDIKIELQGNSAKFYLDGKLIHNVTRRYPRLFHVIAGRDERTGEIIVKVANASSSAVNAALALNGMKAGQLQGQSWVLTSQQSTDENSFDSPERIVPKAQTIRSATPTLNHTFAPKSVTILRLKTVSR